MRSCHKVRLPQSSVAAAGLTVLAGLLSCIALRAETAEAPPALLATTGIKGGLCLVIGAKDLALARSLAAASALYVQVLQPDPKRAAEWGAVVASSDFPDREKLGIRNSAFDPDHYGSDLLNLIVVEDAAALEKARLADLCRMLVPGGCVALRAAPANFAQEAGSLGMVALEAEGSFRSIYRKTTRPVVWKPADSLKWRAGHRAHMAIGVSGVVHGAGRYFYREHVEAQDAFAEGRTQLFARDAYNGRVLWTRLEDAEWKQCGGGMWTPPAHCLAADDRGRLFAYTGDGRFVCLDAATGQPRFELMASGAQPGVVLVHQDRYVLFNSRVFSAESGETLWKVTPRTTKTALHGDTLIESDDATLRMRNLADGREILKVGLEWYDRKNVGTMLVCGNRIILTEGGRWTRPFRVHALDLATGQKVWSHELGGVFAGNPKTNPIDVNYTEYQGKLLAYTMSGPDFHHAEGGQQFHFTRFDPATGRIERDDFGDHARGMFGGFCGGARAHLGDYYCWWFNCWLDLRTMERTFPNILHPGCYLQSAAAYGMIYNYPGRKGGLIQGMTAIGPADIVFDHEPGGRVLQRYADRPALREPAGPSDWPTFRGDLARSNAFGSDLGAKLVKVWETRLGLGGQTYGMMSSRRTGLTQAVSAYGMVYVADIDAQRVVALDVQNGKQKWAFHVGSRVDFPPTIYNGLCLFAAKDGFAYCLDAATGQPIYKLLVAPRERFIGGQEKLESLWPTAADVMVKDGIGYCSAGFGSTVHGGCRTLAFTVDSGEVVWARCFHEESQPTGYPGPSMVPGLFTWAGAIDRVAIGSHFVDVATGQPKAPAAGMRLSSRAPIDDMLAYENSISRTNEDRGGELFGDGRLSGRCIAFDRELSVAYTFAPIGEAWANKGALALVAAKEPKKPLWKLPGIEMVVDDILLTPQYAYCVGHYQRIVKGPELWVVSRDDGKVVATLPVDGFPAFCGMSAAANRLFISTREGKLLCYQGN